MKTVKVRVAVAVDATGVWNSCGWSTAVPSDQPMHIAVEGVADGEARYWLEAELAVPEVITVKASIS